MKKMIVVGFVAAAVLNALSGCSTKATETVAETIYTEEVTEESVFEQIQGIHDYYVLVNSEDVDFMGDISYNGEAIENITVDDSKVDYKTVGTYTISYTVVLSESAVSDERQYVYTVNVYIIDKEDKDKVLDAGETILTNSNEKIVSDKVKETKKETTGESTSKDTQSSGTSNSNSSSGASSNTGSAQTKPSANTGSSSSSSSGQNSNTAGSNSSSGTSSNTGSTQTKPSANTGSSSSGSANSNVSSGNSSSGNSSNTESSPSTEKIWHDPVYVRTWVVDVEEWEETVETEIYDSKLYFVCAVCNEQFETNAEAYEHLSKENHGNFRDVTDRKLVGYKTETITHPEEGHWENVLVKEGYWE